MNEKAELKRCVDILTDLIDDSDETLSKEGQAADGGDPNLYEVILISLFVASVQRGDESEIETIVSFLGHKNPRIRKIALCALALSECYLAYCHIFKCLSGDDPALRDIALKLVKGIGKKRCLQVIEKTLTYPVEWHRRAAVVILDHFDFFGLHRFLSEKELLRVVRNTIEELPPSEAKHQESPLEYLLNSSNESSHSEDGSVSWENPSLEETVLISRLVSLAIMKGEDSIDYISSFLSHPHSLVRQSAFNALLRIESTGIYPYILDSMLNDDPILKKTSASLIKIIRKKGFLQILKGVLDSEADRHRKTAMELLERFRSRRVLSEEEVIHVLRSTIIESSSSEKKTSADFLSDIKKASDQLLRKQEGGNGDHPGLEEIILVSAIVSESRMGNEKKIEYVADFLNHKSAWVKKAAFFAVSIFESCEILSYVFSFLLNGDPDLKQLSIRRIRIIEKTKLNEYIRQNLNSPVDGYREITRTVLDDLISYEILSEKQVVDVLKEAILEPVPKSLKKENLTKLISLAQSGSQYAQAVCKEIRDTLLSKRRDDSVNASELSPSEKSRPFGEKLQKRIKNSAFSLNQLKIFFTRPTYRHYIFLGCFLFISILGWIYLIPESTSENTEDIDTWNLRLANITEKLESEGFRLNKNRSGEPSLFCSDVYASGSQNPEKLLNCTILFSAYSESYKNSEIFESEVIFDEKNSISQIGQIRNLTQTPSVNEYELVALPRSYIYISDLEEGKILTVEDWNHANKRQFLVKKPIDVVGVMHSSLGDNLIRIEATGKERKRFSVYLNVDLGAVDPPDFPVEYIPNSEGEEDFVPAMVEKVRSLPFVGPEKIARLEDMYYQTTDYFKRKIYDFSGEVQDGPPFNQNTQTDKEAPLEGGKEEQPEDRPSVYLADNGSGNASESVPDLPAVNDGSVQIETTPARPADSDIVQMQRDWKEDPYPFQVFSLGLLEKSNRFGSRYAHPDPSTVKAGGFTYADPRDNETGPTPMKIHDPDITDPPIAAEQKSTFSLAPPRIDPLFKQPMEGEGVWIADDTPRFEDEPCIYKTSLRVDGQRPFAVMYFASMDLSKLDIHLMPGTEEPISSVGLRGRGKIPDKVHPNLVCSFNGGFRTKHGRWGFISGGVTYLPPVKGIATIAVDSQNRVRMGTWGKSWDPKEKYIYLRQNLPPLVEDGKPNEKQKYWGGTLGGKTHVWRSAIGMTRDQKRLIYGAGNSLSNQTLAAGMIMAGCDYAMQLDINDYHTYFFLYREKPDNRGKLKISPIKLTDKMIANSNIGLIHYVRDFFYVTGKESPTHIVTKR